MRLQPLCCDSGRLLVGLGQLRVRWECKDVERAEEDQRGVDIEGAWHKHIRICFEGAVSRVGCCNEAPQAGQFSVDWVPLDARQHQSDHQHQTTDKLDHRGQIGGRGLELGLDGARFLEQMLWIEKAQQSCDDEAQGGQVGEVAVVVLGLGRLRRQRVRGEREDVERAEEEDGGVDVEEARHEQSRICLEGAVGGVAGGDEAAKASHLAVFGVPAHAGKRHPEHQEQAAAKLDDG
mmetsp:Transcript_39764/g.118987  ORF Transcript_39764/g.118987 Transcript_39764/m.118987 type:complete len:235 (-) Transcript_39764:235-939(-)